MQLNTQTCVEHPYTQKKIIHTYLVHYIDIPGEHVDLALVHAELADVGLEEEHVCALHAGVEDLRRAHLLRVLAAHDRAAPLR